jgi:hypothetical protein
MKTTTGIWRLIILACLLFTTFIIPCKDVSGQEEKVLPEKKLPEVRVIRFDHVNVPSIDMVKVPSGTTVVWVNGLAGYTLEIKFISKKVTLACSSPIHFIVDEDGAFVSNKIPFGGVASLCFIEKGEFDYVVKRVPQRQPPVQDVKGKVLVE